MATLGHARRELARRCGVSVAAKATDAFALLNGGGSTPPWETGASMWLPTIVEFEVPSVDTALAPARQPLHDAHRALTRALAAERREAMGNAAASAIRRHSIDRARDAFFLANGPALLDIERRAAGPRMVEVCWLNGTVRTWLPPPNLSLFADRAEVARLDVRRQIFPELDRTRTLVGVNRFVARHHLSGAGVTVAVIDGEIALEHPALRGRVVHRGNYSRDAWGNPGTHGTGVAGIIGANGRFLGMAPETMLYNYKVLGASSGRHGDDFDCAMAIQQALEDGAHVANLSFGAEGLSDGTSRLTTACDNAWKLGMVMVKSAGNRKAYGSVTVPGDAAGVIVVGATDRGGKGVTKVSSRGPTANGEMRPHLVAPGGEDDDGDPMTSCSLNGSFASVGAGTSFAAAHVSGIVALMLEKDPLSTPDELRADLLAKRCQRLTAEFEEAAGAGRLAL